MGTYYASSVTYSTNVSGGGIFITPPANPVGLTFDQDFATYHLVQGSQPGVNGISATWNISFAGSLPNDSRPIVLKARVRLDTSGAAPDRSGTLEMALTGSNFFFDRPRINWGTGTGNLATGDTDLFVGQYSLGTFETFPLRANFLLSQVLTLRLAMFAKSSGTHFAEARVYEFFVEDGAPPGEVVSTMWPAP